MPGAFPRPNQSPSMIRRLISYVQRSTVIAQFNLTNNFKIGTWFVQAFLIYLVTSIGQTIYIGDTTILQGLYLNSEVLHRKIWCSLWLIIILGNTGIFKTPPHTRHPLQTLVSHRGKFALILTPIPECLESYTMWVLSNLIYGNYNNADILLNLNM